jgi:hypothetical protein
MNIGTPSKNPSKQWMPLDYIKAFKWFMMGKSSETLLKFKSLLILKT